MALLYTLGSSYAQIRATQFDWAAVDIRWWLAALASYLVAMLLSGYFWHRVLIALGQQPELTDSMFAFLASQLGKYIPGKAMVIVIRTDMIRGPQVQTAPAAASVFVETLTWIFVASVIASVLLIARFEDQATLRIGAAALMVVAGGLTYPPLLGWLARKLGAARGSTAATLLDGLDLKTMTLGWGLMSLGWCCSGLSLWLVIAGLPGNDLVASDFGLTLVCVTLATVAGFVSLLPGGIGVRELVMIPLLGARFGPATAAVAAIVIRLVWLTAELTSSGMIYWVRRRSTLKSTGSSE